MISLGNVYMKTFALMSTILMTLVFLTSCSLRSPETQEITLSNEPGGLEIVWFRIMGVMLKSTAFTFGILLFIYAKQNNIAIPMVNGNAAAAGKGKCPLCGETHRPSTCPRLLKERHVRLALDGLAQWSSNPQESATERKALKDKLKVL